MNVKLKEQHILIHCVNVMSPQRQLKQTCQLSRFSWDLPDLTYCKMPFPISDQDSKYYPKFRFCKNTTQFTIMTLISNSNSKFRANSQSLANEKSGSQNCHNCLPVSCVNTVYIGAVLIVVNWNDGLLIAPFQYTRAIDS